MKRVLYVGIFLFLLLCVACNEEDAPASKNVDSSTAINHSSLTTPTTPVNTPTLRPSPTPQATATATSTTIPTPPNHTGQIIYNGSREKAAEPFIMNSDGSNLHQLANIGWITNLAWSPNGKQIAFGCNNYYSSDGNLYIVNANGTNLHLISNITTNGGLSWKPDSRKIAFVGRDHQIYTADIEDISNFQTFDNYENRSCEREEIDQFVSERYFRQITNNDFLNEYPVWSYDGSQIAFTSYNFEKETSDIYLTDSDGRNLRRLTEDERAIRLTWSPGDKQIAFWSAFSADGNGKGEIKTLDVGDGNVRNLSNHEAEDGYPAWSPDGKQIAFVSERDGNKEIYIVDADGSNLKKLTDYEGYDWFPSWSPDGRQIAFIRDSEIHVMNSDGSDIRRLTDTDTWNTETAWQP